ncbi:MAG TPA: hypothetical protein ENJ42_03755 [Hellea balneolensis]|uniref:PepSY domain-containing protein n=1 Tax=Hellea balneolensis TaxID=287478 RepID=A0A7C5LZT9_9PROT|nr:hypothetical protein [Hellea balneolensis]
MMKRIRVISLFAFATLLALPMGANASGYDRKIDDLMPVFKHMQTRTLEAPTYFAQNQQRKISASRAKSIAQSRVRGAKYVDVQLVRPDLYRVRLQKDGRIIDVYVDAYTGAVRN